MFTILSLGKQEHAEREVPEQEKKYPEYSMFGSLSAYGFFCRHLDNARMHNLDLTLIEEDARPALVFDDVKQLDLFGLFAEASAKAKSLMRMRKVKDAYVHGCRARHEAKKLAEIGEDCEGILWSEDQPLTRE